MDRVLSHWRAKNVGLSRKSLTARTSTVWRLAGSSPSLPSISSAHLVFALVFALCQSVSFSPPNWASTTASQSRSGTSPEDSRVVIVAPWRAIFAN